MMCSINGFDEQWMHYDLDGWLICVRVYNMNLWMLFSPWFFAMTRIYYFYGMNTEESHSGEAQLVPCKFFFFNESGKRAADYIKKKNKSRLDK
jgi:hypothetical protein